MGFDESQDKPRRNIAAAVSEFPTSLMSTGVEAGRAVVPVRIECTATVTRTTIPCTVAPLTAAA